MGMTFKNMVYECQVGVLNRSLSKALLQGSTLLQDCGAIPLQKGTRFTRLIGFPWGSHTFSTCDHLRSFGVGLGDSVAGSLGSGGFNSELSQWNRKELVIRIHLQVPDRWQLSLLLLQFNITGTCLNDSDDDSPDLDLDGNEGPLALLMSNGRWGGKKEHRDNWDCQWQHVTETGHGVETWVLEMGGGGTVLGEIPRYYQVSLLSSENHGSIGGEAWNLIGSLRKILYEF